MSYFEADADGSSTNHGSWEIFDHREGIGGPEWYWHSAATPLLHDIAAMQAIYGADMDTRTDNTVYGFNSNAGRTIGGGTYSYNPYSFVQNPNPVFAIWDADGTDTIDASGFTTNQKINLAEGAFSSISESGILTDNVAIAFGARIENAIGGSGDDEIRGNALENRLEGRDGNDTLIAGVGPGADELVGGSGNDVLMGSGGDILRGGLNNDAYYVTAADTVIEDPGHGTDTVHTTLSTYRMTAYVENLNFSNSEFYPTDAHTAHGNSEGNTITGGRGVDTFYGDNGVDHLYGRAGNDSLNGGAHGDFLYGEDDNDTLSGDAGVDELHGGAGNDTLNGGTEGDFLFGGANNDTLRGDAGNDRLVGGAGKDWLTGGGDADTFVFNSTSDSWREVSYFSGAVIDQADTITDFVRGVDMIDLRGIDANAATPSAVLNERFWFLSDPAAHRGDWTAKLWVEHTIMEGSTLFGTRDTTGWFSTTTLFASTDTDPMAEFQINFSGRVNFTGSSAEFMF
jgi:serralysin